MPQRKTFCAFGAYAVNVTVPDESWIMAVASSHELGELDPSKYVKLNLRERLRSDNFAEAVLDTTGVHGDGKPKGVKTSYDPKDGINVLTIGPVFYGQHEGGIYMLRDKFYREVRPLIDPKFDEWPYFKWKTYEVMTSAVLDDAGTLRRFHGFHAKVTADRGAIKELEIQKQKIEIDFGKLDYCDNPSLLASEVKDPAHPEITPALLDATSSNGVTGGVFLEISFAATKLLRSPKQPPGGG